MSFNKEETNDTKIDGNRVGHTGIRDADMPGNGADSTERHYHSGYITGLSPQ